MTGVHNTRKRLKAKFAGPMGLHSYLHTICRYYDNNVK